MKRIADSIIMRYNRDKKKLPQGGILNALRLAKANYDRRDPVA